MSNMYNGYGSQQNISQINNGFGLKTPPQPTSMNFQQLSQNVPSSYGQTNGQQMNTTTLMNGIGNHGSVGHELHSSSVTQLKNNLQNQQLPPPPPQNGQQMPQITNHQPTNGSRSVGPPIQQPQFQQQPLQNYGNFVNGSSRGPLPPTQHGPPPQQHQQQQLPNVSGGSVGGGQPPIPMLNGQINPTLNGMRPPTSQFQQPPLMQQHQQQHHPPGGIPPVANINQLIPNLQNISLNQNNNQNGLQSAQLPPPPSSLGGRPPQSQVHPPIVNNNPISQVPPTFAQPPNNSVPPVSISKQPQRPMYPSAQQMPPQQPQNQQYMANQYPQQQQQHQPQQQTYKNVQSGFGATPAGAGLQYQPQGSVTHSGFNSMWGHPEVVDLMQQRHILPPEGYTPPLVSLNNQFSDSVNCDPDIFRCTLTKIPETNKLLQNSRLPLGVLIHPFRDLGNLPVVSCSQIVRCRACRTYINPFVYFVDTKKWKCNLCYRVNELPDEFQYDPVTKSYGDVTRRPEVRSSTIEFIAPSEYMLRPPQPAIYLFLLDVSLLAVQSGYLSLVCDGIAEHLDKMPGDARAQIGFIAYDSAVHFYSIAEGFSRPHEITVLDLDEVFMPRPDSLLINIKENRDLINDLLDMLPKRFENTYDNGSALGAALQVAFKMMSATGGRVSVFQTCLPNKGPGALQMREDPNNRSSKDVNHLGPATDFYKKLALEFSGQQIAADIFLLNSQYSDLATLSGISKFSGGCIYHFPLFNAIKKPDSLMFRKTFERYLTRKIGFESVMRVRCTRGLTIHSFHGNFFVRSTDLLSLPNVSPDAGFGMQISYDESLTDVKSICFQAALLYTSSKGERRIRVHTLCLPVTNSLNDVINSADSHAIIGLLSKMAVDRSIQASLPDARDAFINATVDILASFKLSQNQPVNSGNLQAPKNLSLLPLYILALLKNTAFRTGTSTRLDDRIFSMCEMKSLPLDQLMKYIYPDFYHIDCLFEKTGDGEVIEPPLLQLSSECLDSRSMFLMDTGTKILIYVGSNVRPDILKNVIGVDTANQIHDLCFDLQSLETPENEKLHAFIDHLNDEKPFPAVVQIIRDTSTSRPIFVEKLYDDRTESSLSYYEFLQHLRTQVK